MTTAGRPQTMGDPKGTHASITTARATREEQP
jgi:hypothetical protein